ncbi:MAG: hypothetical protein CME06_14305 [Gemmatimonadetes bacterium]|nr:hypothetical protein [Gemmatimonadota bacterium]
MPGIAGGFSRRLRIYAAAVVLFVVAGVLHRGAPAPETDPVPQARVGGAEQSVPCASFVPDLVEISARVGDGDLRAAERIAAGGDRLYNERDLAWGNLYEAMIVWNAAAREAAGIASSPPLLYDLLDRILIAEKEFCERFRFHRSSAEVAFAAGDLERALYHAQVVLESIPDPFDARYQWAKEMQLECRPAAEE